MCEPCKAAVDKGVVGAEEVGHHPARGTDGLADRFIAPRHDTAVRIAGYALDRRRHQILAVESDCRGLVDPFLAQHFASTSLATPAISKVPCFPVEVTS